MRAACYLAATAMTLVMAIPAQAQDARTDAYEANDIVVTARRVEERLQDVPISMTVFSQQQLADRNIVSATDLGTYTPSLSVNQRYGPEKASFAIRGFSQEIGTSPSVGVYFADVVAPRAAGSTVSGNSAAAGSFMDLQNVQVLKGPQGTLFGRNTTGGAVLLVPTKPTDRLEGFIEGSGGNYGMWRAHGVLNLPLADTFKVRLAVDRNRREGYMKNRSGIGARDYNDVNYFAARFSVVADLTPDLENYTIATYSNSFSNGYGARLEICERDPALRTGGRFLTGLAACNQIDRQAARGDGPLDVDIDNSNPFVKIKQWQVINTTRWNVSDALTVKNIVSYSEFRERASFSLGGDNFFVTAPFPSAGTKFQHILINPPLAGKGDGVAQSTFTEEFQLQGVTAAERLTWQVGGYLELSRPLGYSMTYVDIFLNCASIAALQCTNPMGVGFIAHSATKHSFDNKGIYAQATYDFTDQLSLTGGLRYTMDKTSALGESTRFLLPPGGATPIEVCDDSLRFSNPDGSTPRVVATRVECRNRIVETSKKPTWLVGVDYKPAEDILLYVKYSRGYRQGGIQMSNIGIETWRPERVEAFEAGAKTSFRGDAVGGSFNIAAFYNDFRDQQIFGGLISKDQSKNIGGAAIVNAGRSRIQGVEVDASLTLFDALRFDLGYTYLDTRVKDIVQPVLDPNSPFAKVTFSAEVGDPLPLSPKHRVNLSATYSIALGDDLGDLALGANFVHTAKQLANANSPLGVLPATNLVNLSANWTEVLGRPFDLAFFVTNLTNEIYPVGVIGQWSSGGYDGSLRGPPRMWGGRVRYNF